MKNLWKRTVFSEFRVNRPKFYGNCKIPQNFHTKKLGEITVFYSGYLIIKNIWLNTIQWTDRGPAEHFSLMIVTKSSYAKAKCVKVKCHHWSVSRFPAILNKSFIIKILKFQIRGPLLLNLFPNFTILMNIRNKWTLYTIWYHFGTTGTFVRVSKLAKRKTPVPDSIFK